MKEILLLTVICVVFGSGLGAFLGIFFGAKKIGITLAFTGGLMMAIVFFDLLPAAMTAGNLITVILGFFIGIFFVSLIEKMISGREYRQQNVNQSLVNAGIVMLIAMALHNFPEGMAIGSAGTVDYSSGFLVALMITLHDIPEAMAIATPLSGGNVKRGKVFFLTILSGISTVLGAVIGFWIGKMSDFGLALCLGAAGGAMLYIVFADMIPEAFKEINGKNCSIFVLIGIIFGIMLIKIIK